MNPEPSMHARRLLFSSLILLIWPVLIGGQTSKKATGRNAGATDLFDALYERTRPQQASLQTIRAKFIETTVSTLLTKPLVARGDVIAAKPGRIRLDYSSPERKTVVIDAGRLVVLWPDRKEREELDVGQFEKRIDRYFVDRTPVELRKHFDISAAADAKVPGTYRIDMIPKRKQIKTGLSRLELWVDQERLLLTRMRMSFPGGDSKTLAFEGIELNVPLGPSAFSVKP